MEGKTSTISSACLRLLYNFLWWPTFVPIALTLGGLDWQKLSQRLGFLPTQLPLNDNRTRLWLHAASVGEIEGIAPVAQSILNESAKLALLVTCMTETGCLTAKKRLPKASCIGLAPLDLKQCVRRFLRQATPRVLLLIETELWPNYVFEAHAHGVRTVLINARMSERSMSRYRLVRPLIRELLSKIELVLAQTDEDAERYRQFGVPESKLEVVGNPKYDLSTYDSSRELRPSLIRFVKGRPVFVAGSTGPGEESVIVEAFKLLRTRIRELALVIAPRHLDRTEEVAATVRAARLEFVQASLLESERAIEKVPVLILDTMGELRAIYRYAAVAFVGGSLYPGRGGQSLAEPAAAGVPVIFGPFHESQRTVAARLIETQGGYVVRDVNEIVMTSARLLVDENLRASVGERARLALEGLQGSSQRILKALKRVGNLF